MEFEENRIELRDRRGLHCSCDWINAYVWRILPVEDFQNEFDVVRKKIQRSLLL